MPEENRQCSFPGCTRPYYGRDLCRPHFRQQSKGKQLKTVRIVKISTALRKHGQYENPIYKIWVSMIHRCTNPKDRAFPRYGGRGVTVCQRWQGSPEGFLNFLADIGPRPSSRHTLDRKETEGNYEPSNCRWATWEEQNRNKRNNRLLEFRGETKTATEWSKLFSIKASTLFNRLKRGMSVESALTTPSARSR